MRARQFILEYQRDRTLASPGLADRLWDAMRKDVSTARLPGFEGTIDAMMRRAQREDELTAKNNPDLEPTAVKELKRFYLNKIFDFLENKFQGSLQRYIPWIVQSYIKDYARGPQVSGATGHRILNQPIWMEDILSKYPDILNDYLYLQQRRLLPQGALQLNQLGLTQVRDIVDSLRDKLGGSAEERKREQQIKALGKPESEKVYNDDKVTVYVPRNMAAACSLGSRDWCTAIPDTRYNYYDRYARDGDLYIIKPKHPRYEGEQYQLHFPSDQFMDERDNGTDLVELFNRYPEMFQFFKKQEPGYFNDTILWASDETLKPLLDRMAEYMDDHLWEIISDWEMDDDYYREWQAEQARERGYLLMPDRTPYNPKTDFDRLPGDDDDEKQDSLQELDIDWDRVQEDYDLNNYLEWNYEADRWLDRARRAVHMSPEEMRQTIYNYGENMNDTLESLPSLMMDHVREKLGRDDGGSVVDAINKHLEVGKFLDDGQNKSSKGTWQVRWWSPTLKKYY